MHTNEYTQEEYDRDEEVRQGTIRRQLGVRPFAYPVCVLLETEDGELIADYDLCAYLD